MLRVTQLSGFGAGGESAAALITSVDSVEVNGGETLAFTITTDANATITIGGADAAQVELASNPSSTSRVLRWASNGVQDYDVPMDDDDDNVYEITLTTTRTSSGVIGNPSDFTITVDRNWVTTWTANPSAGGGITNLTGETWRVLMPAADLSESGKMVRATLKGNTSGFSISPLYIGKKAASGDAYDMEASSPAPTQLLKNSGVVFTTTNLFDHPVSDGVYFDFDESQSYIMGAHFLSGGTLVGTAPGSVTGSYSRKAGVNEAGTADVTGYTTSSGQIALVSKIEVVEFVESYNEPLSTPNSGWSGKTMRQSISAGSLGRSGNRVRLVLKGDPGAGWSIDALYIGEKASSGDLYDMKASVPTPAQFLVSGSGSFASGSDKRVITDALSFVIDDTKDYIITAHFSATSSIPIVSGAGNNLYSKSAVNEASTADVTGYSLTAGNSVGLIEKILVAL